MVHAGFRFVLQQQCSRTPYPRTPGAQRRTRTHSHTHTPTRHAPQLLGNEVLHSSASTAKLAGFASRGELAPVEERLQSLFLGAGIIV